MKGVTPSLQGLFQNRLRRSASGRLRLTVTRIMQQPGRSPVFSVASLLWLFSTGYGAGVKLRRSMYRSGVMHSKAIPCKVISVGNLTLGGTGKSPMTVFLAQRIQQMGYRVAVCSRGYGGRASRRGGVVSDGRRLLMTSEDAGDEPVMMAAKMEGVPVVIGKDRYDAGLMAVNRFKVDVLVLDDAFQHLRLKRDINLLLMDSRHPFGNGHLFPRGELREPDSAIIDGDAIVFTRSCHAGRGGGKVSGLKLDGRYRGLPQFNAQHTPVLYRFTDGRKSRVYPEEVGGLRVLAFSGIAKNRHFKETLADLRMDLTGFLGFPDHYPYTDDDIRQINDRRSKGGAEYIVTTEKDMTRIHHLIGPGQMWLAVGIDISFSEDDEAFTEFIKNRIVA